MAPLHVVSPNPNTPITFTKNNMLALQLFGNETTNAKAFFGGGGEGERKLYQKQQEASYHQVHL